MTKIIYNINMKIRALYKQYITIDKYFIKQKSIGFTMAVMGVLSAIVTDGDITAAVMIVPLGVWLMFTKNKAIYESEREESTQ